MPRLPHALGGVRAHVGLERARVLLLGRRRQRLRAPDVDLAVLGARALRMRLSVRKRVRARGQAAQRERRGAGRRGGGVGVCSGGVVGRRVCGGGGGAELDGGVVELLEERVEIDSSGFELFGWGSSFLKGLGGKV